MPVKRISDFECVNDVQDWLMSYGIFVTAKRLQEYFADYDNSLCDWRFQVWRRPGQRWQLTTGKRDIE